jgi:prepilin-type N-terminal cleavage/methylation domain-containing protein
MLRHEPTPRRIGERQRQTALPKATRQRARAARRAFTLIELMIAVGIMAVMLTIGLPRLYQSMDKDSMRKAASDVMEACSTARARAILDSTTTELRIRPADREFSVVVVGNPRPAQPAAPEGHEFGAGRLPERTEYQWGDRMAAHDEAGTSAGGAACFSVKLGSGVMIEGLGVNGEDWTEDAQARVRFYPNGTCDAMSIILLSDKGERRNIFLEVVTGFADFEVDPLKFRVR